MAPAHRRTGLATSLVAALETASDAAGCHFVDLFVRASNKAAIKLYEGMGYNVYRRVTAYYGASPSDGTPAEDALDMRKALAADPEGRSVVPLGRDVPPDELEWH